MWKFMCFYSLHHTVPHLCHHHITTIYTSIISWPTILILVVNYQKLWWVGLKFDFFLYVKIGMKHHTFCYSSFTKTNISNQPTKKLICTKIYVYDKVFMGWWAAGLTICSWVDSYTFWKNPLFPSLEKEGLHAKL